MVIVLAIGLLAVAVVIHAGAIRLCSKHTREPPTSGSNEPTQPNEKEQEIAPC